MPLNLRSLGFIAMLSMSLLYTRVAVAQASAEPQASQAAAPGAALHRDPPRKGWFWYRDPVEKKEQKEEPVLILKPKEEAPLTTAPIVVIPKIIPTNPETPLDEERLCSQKDTWVAKCGFVDPGDDFDFQAIQRDELLKLMSMRPDSPDAVEGAQRYMKWVVGRASMAANMWYFNMIQNPDLDPTVKNPISEIGLALASRVEQASQSEYFKLIREEGGLLFYITRNDCIYCHDQAPNTQRVAHTMGLPLINVPLDQICLPGFEGETCGNNIAPEQVAVLDVKIVPALYLYVPSATWIRIGTGVVSDSKVLANTVNFFSAYRAAMLSGLDNSKGARPSVTFDPELRPSISGSGTVSAEGRNIPGAPDRKRMMELLGYGDINQK